MVYLTLELERCGQRYIKSVVAHEFTRVLLHNFNSSNPPSMEREADEEGTFVGISAGLL